jgi:hypothetical protein
VICGPENEVASDQEARIQQLKCARSKKTSRNRKIAEEPETAQHDDGPERCAKVEESVSPSPSPAQSVPAATIPIRRFAASGLPVHLNEIDDCA